MACIESVWMLLTLVAQEMLLADAPYGRQICVPQLRAIQD